MTHLPITITARELQEAEEAPAPRRRRGRPRKHPEGTRAKPVRSVPQQKVQPGSLADLARWKLAAAAAGLKLSPWLARVATAAADAQLGPAATPSTD